MILEDLTRKVTFGSETLALFLGLLLGPFLFHALGRLLLRFLLLVHVLAHRFRSL